MIQCKQCEESWAYDGLTDCCHTSDGCKSERQLQDGLSWEYPDCRYDYWKCECGEILLIADHACYPETEDWDSTSYKVLPSLRVLFA